MSPPAVLKPSAHARLPGGRVVGGCRLLLEAWRSAAGLVWIGREEAGGGELVLVGVPSRPPSPRLLDEMSVAAKALLGLKHPKLLPLRRVSVQDELALVTDYVDGESLRSLMSMAAGAVPRPVAVRLVADYLEALSALLSMAGPARERVAALCSGVGAEGLVVSAGGEIKVAPHGFSACVAAAPSWVGKGLDGASLLPPELGSSPFSADARSAVFGAGVLLWELLTGRSSAGMAASAAGPLLAPLGAAASPALGRLVARATERAAAARFASPAEMRSALLAAGGAPAQGAELAVWVNKAASKMLASRRGELALLLDEPSGHGEEPAPITPRMAVDVLDEARNVSRADGDGFDPPTKRQPIDMRLSSTPVASAPATVRKIEALRPGAFGDPSPATPRAQEVDDALDALDIDVILMGEAAPSPPRKPAPPPKPASVGQAKQSAGRLPACAEQVEGEDPLARPTLVTMPNVAESISSPGAVAPQVVVLSEPLSPLLVEAAKAPSVVTPFALSSSASEGPASSVRGAADMDDERAADRALPRVPSLPALPVPVVGTGQATSFDNDAQVAPARRRWLVPAAVVAVVVLLLSAVVVSRGSEGASVDAFVEGPAPRGGARPLEQERPRESAAGEVIPPAASAPLPDGAEDTLPPAARPSGAGAAARTDDALPQVARGVAVGAPSASAPAKKWKKYIPDKI